MLAVAIPILVVAISLILRAAFSRFAIMQQSIDAINSTIQENLIGQRVVKAFVREEYESAKFKNSNDALTEAAIRAVSIVILSMPVMMLVMNGATLAIIWLGGKMVFGGALGAGELISFSQLRVPDPDERDDDLDGFHHVRASPGQRRARAGGAGGRGGHRRQARAGPGGEPAPGGRGEGRVPQCVLQVQPDRQRAKMCYRRSASRPSRAR